MNKKPCRILLFHSVSSKDSDSDPEFRIAPIGLFFIAGALKKNGFESKIIPIHLPAFSSFEYKESLKQKIQNFDPDFIGYSFRNLYSSEPPVNTPPALIDFFSVSLDLPVIQFIRTCSDAPVIGGGSGFSLAPEFYMKTLSLDYGIQGEGDLSVALLVNSLRQRQDTDSIPGLVYRKGPTIIKNTGIQGDNGKTWHMDISAFNDHKDLYYGHGGYGSIQTKRGCAFHCTYCVYPYLEGKSYRLRPVEKVIEEIGEYLHKYRMAHIYFVDSVFSSPSLHSHSIVEAIIESRLNIHWYAYINPSGLTPALLEKFKASGCAGLVLTLESGSDVVLDYLKKGFSKKDAVTAVENLMQVNIPFEVSMMVGTPKESEESLNETLLFCRNYLRSVPVTFSQGVWMHPVSPLFSEYYQTKARDVDSLSGLILSNDLKGHNNLHYFFTKQNNRQGLIQSFFSEVDKEPLWFILGKDMVPDPRAGIMRFSKKDPVKRYCRPWFSGIGGYPHANE
jgi:hypothetical protein